MWEGKKPDRLGTRSGNKFSDFVCSRRKDSREDKWGGLLLCLSFIIITGTQANGIMHEKENGRWAGTGDRMIEMVLFFA